MKASVDIIQNGVTKHLNINKGYKIIRPKEPRIIIDVFQKSADSQTDGVAITVDNKVPFCNPLLGNETHWELSLPDVIYRVVVTK